MAVTGCKSSEMVRPAIASFVVTSVVALFLKKVTQLEMNKPLFMGATALTAAASYAAVALYLKPKTSNDPNKNTNNDSTPPSYISRLKKEGRLSETATLINVSDIGTGDLLIFYLKTTNKTVYTVIARDDLLVGELQELLPSPGKIIFRGKTITEDLNTTLASYNIKNGNECHIIFYSKNSK